MKTKKFKSVLLITMSAIILLILSSLLLIGNPQPLIASAADNNNQIAFDEFTDSDVLYEERMLTIRDYPELLYNSTASIREGINF